MAVDIVLLILAAIGLLSLCWAVLGWLLPGGRGMVLVCFGVPDPGMLARWRWLRGLGLMAVPLILVTQTETLAPEDTEICSPEALLSRLEWERKQTHGTRNGDSSGHHQCRGISEL